MLMASGGQHTSGAPSRPGAGYAQVRLVPTRAAQGTGNLDVPGATIPDLTYHLPNHLAALSADPGGATVAAIAAHAGISTAAAHDYPLVPIQVFFVSLIVVEPLTIVLLWFVRQEGIWLACAVMVVDMAANWIGNWSHIRDDWALRVPWLITVFGLFVLSFSLPMLRLVSMRRTPLSQGKRHGRGQHRSVLNAAELLGSSTPANPAPRTGGSIGPRQCWPHPGRTGVGPAPDWPPTARGTCTRDQGTRRPTRQ